MASRHDADASAGRPRSAALNPPRHSVRRPATPDILLPNGERLSLPAFRALFAAARPRKSSLVVDETIAGRAGPIRVRRYRRKETGQPRPAILFLHGGGGIAGSLDSHDALCRGLAAEADLQVIAVEYRLAPEHRFPAGVEDAIDAYCVLQHRARDWSVDLSSLAVMGDGSGASLAAIVSLHARDMCLPMPAAQIMLLPQLEASAGPLCEWVRQHYLPKGARSNDWRLSPDQAASLSGLPPVFLSLAGADIQSRAGLAYAERLRASDVAVEVAHDGSWSPRLPALIGNVPARDVVAQAISFLRKRSAVLQ